jgi:hypothetical protein
MELVFSIKEASADFLPFDICLLPFAFSNGGGRN